MSKHFDRAIASFDRQRLDLAERELRQELAGDPDNAAAHAMLALCLIRREAISEAESEVWEAIRLQPDLAAAFWVLVRIHVLQGRLGEAEAIIQEALRLEPENPDYFEELSVIHLCGSRFPKALQAAQEGLRIDPQHVGCLNLAAVALAEMAEYQQAELAIEKALAQDPNNSRTHVFKGRILANQGKLPSAVAAFREALRIDPEAKETKQDLGRILAAPINRRIRQALGGLGVLLLPAMIVATAIWGPKGTNPGVDRFIVASIGFLVTFGGPALWGPTLAYFFVFLSRTDRQHLAPNQIRATCWVWGLCLAQLFSLAVGVYYTHYMDYLATAFAFLFAPAIVPVTCSFQAPAGPVQRFWIWTAAFTIPLGPIALLTNYFHLAWGHIPLSLLQPVTVIFLVLSWIAFAMESDDFKKNCARKQ